jgi:hypothetical protein
MLYRNRIGLAEEHRDQLCDNAHGPTVLKYGGLWQAWKSRDAALQIDASFATRQTAGVAAYVQFEISRNHDHRLRSISVLGADEAERCLTTDE